MSDRPAPETQEAWLQGLDSWTLCLAASQPCTYCMVSLESLIWDRHDHHGAVGGRACLFFSPEASGLAALVAIWFTQSGPTKWQNGEQGSAPCLVFGEEENMAFMCFLWFSGRMTTIIIVIWPVVLTGYSGKSALGLISWSLQQCKRPCFILHVRKSLRN